MSVKVDALGYCKPNLPLGTNKITWTELSFNGINVPAYLVQTHALTNLKVKQFAGADDASMMVDGEAVLLVAPADVITECWAAKSADGGHIRSNGAVLHNL